MVSQPPPANPYTVPLAQPDGWPIVSAAAAQLSVDQLQSMEVAIRSGVFQKITSVVIARHGHLIYEAYFDDAGIAGLRNTRSVTKTITGMLVGIAIDHGLLPDVTAPILRFLGDRQPLQNPRPA